MNIKPMSEKEVNSKRKKLEGLLHELDDENIDPCQFVDSESLNNLLKGYALRFQDIYSNGYRQMYSELYPILRKTDEKGDYSIDILLANIELKERISMITQTNLKNGRTGPF